MTLIQRLEEIQLLLEDFAERPCDTEPYFTCCGRAAADLHRIVGLLKQVDKKFSNIES